MRLSNKVAVVTGSGRGIGKGIAKVLASEGAAVVICDVNQDDLNKTEGEFQDLGYKALAMKVDVSNREEVARMAATTIERLGSIDILVNNAGIVRDKMAKNMTDEMWDAVLNVNLKAVFICSQECAKSMIERKHGKIVNVSSVAYRGSIGQANYAAAKAGIIGLTRTLALEWARYRINVNCVAPGMIDTDMTRGMPEEVFAAAVSKIPLQRVGTPEDVGKVVLFLASGDSDYLTGQLIDVCGGNTLGTAR
jgi:3-oxoacyl-[acyl-carrier protein] reductase